MSAETVGTEFALAINLRLNFRLHSTRQHLYNSFRSTVRHAEKLCKHTNSTLSLSSLSLFVITNLYTCIQKELFLFPLKILAVSGKL